MFSKCFNKCKKYLIYVTFFVFMIICINYKTYYHEDEIASYFLSNGQCLNHGFAYPVELNFTYSADFYKSLMSTAPLQSFNYKNVWAQQTNDVHPPLYYALLHTICSFFPGKFSKWFAGSINIIFALLTLYFFRKLIYLLSDNKKIVNWLSICFICFPSIYGAVIFFRMYVMAMFCCTVIAYLFLHAIISMQVNKTFLFEIYFISVASALTHYYCILFLILCCVDFGIWLINHKYWKNLAAFIFTMVFSAGTAIGIFPAMIDHIFSGYRGIESFNNLISSNIYSGFAFLLHLDFCQIGGFSIVVLSLTGIIFLYCIFKHKNVAILMQWEGFHLIIPCLIYCFVVANSMPLHEERYFLPIYTVYFATVFALFYKLILSLNLSLKQKISLNILCCCALTVAWIYGSDFIDTYIEPTVSEYNYNDSHLIVVTDPDYQYSVAVLANMPFMDITFYSTNDINAIQNYKYITANNIILLNFSKTLLDESDMDIVLSYFYNINQYCKINDSQIPNIVSNYYQAYILQ